jgi:hypothetical protein
MMPRKSVVAATALIAIAGNTGGAQGVTGTERARLTTLSVAYMLNSLVGARIAIRDSLPEAPFGMRSERSVSQEFFVGSGTALSPGMPFLVSQDRSHAVHLSSGTSGTTRDGRARDLRRRIFGRPTRGADHLARVGPSGRERHDTIRRRRGKHRDPVAAARPSNPKLPSLLSDSPIPLEACSSRAVPTW